VKGLCQLGSDRAVEAITPPKADIGSQARARR
jgi:hypothetical protein